MEPWFDNQTAGMIGGIIGTGIGFMGALIGCSCAICVSKGWKKLVYAMFILAIAISSVLLVTGIVALCVKQPYHVWYGFLLSGFIGTIVFGSGLPVMRSRFIAREMKKMQAEDL
jgi:hypothetical protein